MFLSRLDRVWLRVGVRVKGYVWFGVLGWVYYALTYLDPTKVLPLRKLQTPLPPKDPRDLIVREGGSRQQMGWSGLVRVYEIGSGLGTARKVPFVY